MKTHLAPTETLTVVIDDKEITVTAQQLLGLKQAETTDPDESPDEKYWKLLKKLEPQWYLKPNGDVYESRVTDFQSVPSQLSAQRIRTYIKMLNIAAKLNGEADWNGDGEFIYAYDGEICLGKPDKEYKGLMIKFKHGLALEALTYLNSEDKIAMFGTDKVKED
jgi:hypothetical protein